MENTDVNPVDEAYRIFEEWASANRRNYIGWMVRDNLAGSISRGYSPQQAVDRLIARAPR